MVVVGEGLSESEYNIFYEKFVEKFADAASRMKVGYGLDEAVQMGPLRDKSKKERVVGYIQKGLDEGANLRLDGRELNLVGNWPKDAFLNPTVFDDVAPDMKIAEDLFFGPVACIIRAKRLQDALEMIRDSPFGNSAAIFTQNGKWARHFRYSVECGNIGINVGIVAPMAFFPFSGMKDSFFGDLHGQGQEAIRFFTESKVVIERWF